MRKRYRFAAAVPVGVVVGALLVHAIRNGGQKCYEKGLVEALPHGSSREKVGKT